MRLWRRDIDLTTDQHSGYHSFSTCCLFGLCKLLPAASFRLFDECNTFFHHIRQINRRDTVHPQTSIWRNNFRCCKLTRVVLVSDEQTDIHNSVLFTYLSPNRTSSNCLLHKRPASGCPHKMSFESNHGLQCLNKIWATCLVEDVSIYIWTL